MATRDLHHRIERLENVMCHTTALAVIAQRPDETLAELEARAQVEAGDAKLVVLLRHFGDSEPHQ